MWSQIKRQVHILRLMLMFRSACKESVKQILAKNGDVIKLIAKSEGISIREARLKLKRDIKARFWNSLDTEKFKNAAKEIVDKRLKESNSI